MPSKKGIDLGTSNSSGPSGKNYLLVIAINKYVFHNELFNCVRDAKALVEVLQKRYGFEKENTIELYDADACLSNIYQNLESLMEIVTPEDNLIVYFSGHGFYHKLTSTGHLIPFGAEGWYGFLSNADMRDLIRGINSFHTFLVLDCCFSGSLFAGNKNSALSDLATNVNSLPSRWALAAGLIERVEDGSHGGHSPFAMALLGFLQTNTLPKVPVSELIQYVKKVTPYNGKQTPVGGILFNTGDVGGELVLTLKEEDKTQPDKPKRLAELGYPLVPVEGGKFMMGSDRNQDEKPIHEVQINSFELGKYLVTFNLFDEFCLNTGREMAYDEGWGRGNRPVININWYDAIEFANWLSELEGLEKVYSLGRTKSGIQLMKVRWNAEGYRLPTEAEWEYAARGGTGGNANNLFSGGNKLEKLGWYLENGEGSTHPVGKKEPNQLEIYDLSGNVWEWCWDWYSKDYYQNSVAKAPKGPKKPKGSDEGWLNYKVVRGGSFMDEETMSFLTTRFADYPIRKWNNFGFRLAKTLNL